MKKAVLISIKPKWCELIASGKKTIEVRKTRPRLELPFKCYIYETKGKSDVPTWMDEDGHVAYECGGKVIGEFVCDKVEPRPFGTGIAAYYSNEVGTCLSDIELRLYQTAGKPLYFWHISGLIIYDEPKELREFYKSCGMRNCEKCRFWCDAAGHSGCATRPSRKLASPPQSWCYVEEATNE